MYSFPAPRKPASTSLSVAAGSPTCPTKAPATFADLVAYVEGLDEALKKRRVLITYIRNCAWFIETARIRARGKVDRIHRLHVSLATIPCDVAWINANMGTLPAAVFDISARNHDNSWSGLRSILRRLGLIDPHRHAALQPDGRWADLLNKIASDQYMRLGLDRFAAWCEARGIRPEDVTANTIEDFGLYVRTRLLLGDGHKLVQTVAKAWQKAAALIADWPQIAVRIAARRKPYTMPLTTLPASFQAEVDGLARRLSGAAHQGPFRVAGGLLRPLRPRSIETRLYCLRQAASALVILGRDPATILGLADLVEESAFGAILTFYWERTIATRNARGERDASLHPTAEEGVTAQTGGIATTLMMIARHHCHLDAETLKRLDAMARDVTPKRQDGLTQKNLDRLRQFDDPHVLLKLLHLPTRLMRRAEKADNAIAAARLARAAAAIDIELNIPLRLDNLAKLRLGMDLKFSGDRRPRITHLALTSTQTKNNHNVEWSVSPELSDVLMKYVTKFRHALAAPDNPYLFSAAASKSGPMSGERLGETIKEIIATEVGAEMNTHLFRSLVARLLLDHSPGAIEDVRLLLGDKSMDTVLRHYASREPAAAARRHADVLRKARGGLKPADKPARGKRP